jgi:hypothetical protein
MSLLKKCRSTLCEPKIDGGDVNNGNDELEAICGLLESLLAAEPGQAGRLRPLVGHISRLRPSRHLQDWLLRMYELSAGVSDTSQHAEVSRLV